MGDDSVGVTSLPMTVAARRNARLRAAALATIPLWLFILAALPRVWAPDLVPFGETQAAYVVEAARRAPVPWSEVYGDLSVPTLALVDPLLRELPAPIMNWVVLRGLLDALGVGLLYLAAKRLVGIGPAVLAALLYGASPIAWAAARDPAGPLVAFVMVAALLAAVRLVERPTLLRGAIFGVVLGLLARSTPVGLVVAVAGAVPLALGRASWKVGGLTALCLVTTAGPALFTGRNLLAHGLVSPVDSAGVVGSGLWNAGRSILGLRILGDQAASAQPMVELVVTAVVVAVLVAVLALTRRRLLHWAGVLGMSYLLVVGSIALVLAIRADAEVEQQRQIFAFGPPDAATAEPPTRRSPGAIEATPSLREVTALAAALRETTERTRATEVTTWTGRTARAGRVLPEAPFLGNVEVRSIDGSEAAVLPLERETVFLFSGHHQRFDPTDLPIELQRPSSVSGVFTPRGADTGARIVTLRSRTVADWLGGAVTVSDGRFADGTVLLGVKRRPRSDAQTDLALYWQLPATASSGPLGERFRVNEAEAPQSQSVGGPLLSLDARRSGEIVVQAVHLGSGATASNASTLQVTLYDQQGSIVRTAAGAVTLDVPLESAPR